ncbi:hypothetical protein C4D60_Mb11t16660 [Musa balbisiana]|uniref:Uncharacterized protein n=1 Tax=Musa balbisiana TaxID=52838 RepID=A0A4S8J4L6_MUSBA|nr:hypothetical protein C4D60_Mb11t16660 [Musa balbisiana]
MNISKEFMIEEPLRTPKSLRLTFPPKLSTSSSLRSAARRCRSPPSSSPEAADPVVLADATDVSHLVYLGRATARKVIPFVARTAAKRQSVQLVRLHYNHNFGGESMKSCGRVGCPYGNVLPGMFTKGGHV